MSKRIHRGRRRGTAVVEFACVAPLLLLLLFGIIEFGTHAHGQAGHHQCVL